MEGSWRFKEITTIIKGNRLRTGHNSRSISTLDGCYNTQLASFVLVYLIWNGGVHIEPAYRFAFYPTFSLLFCFPRGGSLRLGFMGMMAYEFPFFTTPCERTDCVLASIIFCRARYATIDLGFSSEGCDASEQASKQTTRCRVNGVRNGRQAR